MKEKNGNKNMFFKNISLNLFILGMFRIKKKFVVSIEREVRFMFNFCF